MGESDNKIGDILLKSGLLIVALSLLLFLFIFYPVFKKELGFIFFDKDDNPEIILENLNGSEKNIEKNIIVPADKNFSIIIPKIGANEKIISNVNPLNESEYQKALKNGVAHAKGTSFPDGKGNVFLFAHSSGNFYENSRMNTVFFLLNKLEKGDKFSIVYKNKIYDYKVSNKKIVADDEVEYLKNNKNEEIVTLMTCWPPGTSYKRLLILGKR